MWGETDEAWMGEILKELNSGKTIGNILLECSSWRRRTRILLNLKKIKRAYEDFVREIGLSATPVTRTRT